MENLPAIHRVALVKVLAELHSIIQFENRGYNLDTTHDQSILPECSASSDSSFDRLTDSGDVEQASLAASFSVSSYETNNSQSNFGIERMMAWLDDPFFGQIREIWSSLREAISKNPHIPVLETVTPSERDAKCLHFFCPSNLTKFLQLYWDEWSLHCPMLHKPTFDAYQVPVLLLLPMVLMGACMSPFETDIYEAKEWLDIAEAMIFSNTLLSVDIREREGANIHVDPLRVIQAAYIICLIQNWEGNDTVKRRIRQQRFVTVIAAARDLGLLTANHDESQFNNIFSFDWERFIRDEETIRAFTCVFLLDNAFMIFNNAPPRMVLHELDLDLTCVERSFQASNAEECYRLWQSSVFAGCPAARKFTLTDAIEILAAPNFDLEMKIRFSNMSILNLFAIISGYHSVLFQQRTLFLCLPTSLLPIEKALNRWKVAWDSRQGKDPPEACLQAWQETSFFGHADEFASLAVARLNNLQLKFPQIPNTAIGQPKASTNAPERFDDTSMSQVTDLMLSLSVFKEQ